MITNQRLYKAEMTAFPPEALVWRREDEIPEWLEGSALDQETRDDGEWYAFEIPGWVPAEWDEYARANELIDLRETEKQGHTVYMAFFWPNTNKVYRSRSSAQDRVNIIEMWGGKAQLLETTTNWIPVEQANKQRRNRARRTRVEKLWTEAQRIADEMED